MSLLRLLESFGMLNGLPPTCSADWSGPLAISYCTVARKRFRGILRPEDVVVNGQKGTEVIVTAELSAKTESGGATERHSLRITLDPTDVPSWEVLFPGHQVGQTVGRVELSLAQQ